MSIKKSILRSTPIVLGLALLYFLFGYHLERSDFGRLMLLYAGLFVFSYALIRMNRGVLWPLLICGLLFRLILIVALPNLSQDFYRFIWDGQMALEGINPYLFTPNALMGNDQLSWQDPALMQSLVDGMGSLSAGNHTSYPPLNQFFFALCTFLGGKGLLGQVLAMRFVIILADLGILYYGQRLLKALKLPSAAILLYFLNPFVILELTGNLHFEGLMLFFLLAALYQLHRGRWAWSAVLFGMSVSVKLIPLMFLPLFYRYFVTKGLFSKGFWRLKYFLWIVIGVVLLSFLPYYSVELMENFAATIALWFQKFEFNASVFYIIRWVGFQVNGWDPIQTAGKILPIIVFGYIVLLAFVRNNRSTTSLLTSMLLAVTFYLFLSTTVHPWYLATPLLLSVFTRYRFVLIWTFFVAFSYSAYTSAGVDEKLWLIAIEYLVVVAVMVWEIRFQRFREKPFEYPPTKKS